MTVLQFVIIFMLTFWGNAFEHLDTNLTVQKYELRANTSKVLQKDDRRIMSGWSEQYQVLRLDVCVKYRMQIVKHEEHNFRSGGNVKWMEFLNIHRQDIRKSKSFYHENELECLRTSTSRDAKKKEKVDQLEKEIVKWRKGYRYLISLCDVENPGNKNNAELCLVKYMQNDRYDQVVDRLMVLKQAAMNELYAYYSSSVLELKDCLDTQLSLYLDRVRSIMDTLSKCYSITT